MARAHYNRRKFASPNCDGQVQITGRLGSAGFFPSQTRNGDFPGNWVSETQCVTWRAAGLTGQKPWAVNLGQAFLPSSSTGPPPPMLNLCGSAGFFSKVRVPQTLTRLSCHHGGTWGHTEQLLALHSRVTLQILSLY